jgi:hypothetical protein
MAVVRLLGMPPVNQVVFWIISHWKTGLATRPSIWNTEFRLNKSKLRECSVFAATSSAPRAPSCASLSTKSFAAVRVKEMARTRLGCTFCSSRRATRRMRAYVLPVPVPATTRSAHRYTRRCSTAFRISWYSRALRPHQFIFADDVIRTASDGFEIRRHRTPVQKRPLWTAASN